MSRSLIVFFALSLMGVLVISNGLIYGVLRLFRIAHPLVTHLHLFCSITFGIAAFVLLGSLYKLREIYLDGGI
jgi:hypothetical protein